MEKSITMKINQQENKMDVNDRKTKINSPFPGIYNKIHNVLILSALQKDFIVHMHISAT